MSAVQAELDLNQRIHFLKQQIKDLDQQLQNECSSSVNVRVQHMHVLAGLKKTLQLKEEVANQL